MVAFSRLHHGSSDVTELSPSRGAAAARPAESGEESGVVESGNRGNVGNDGGDTGHDTQNLGLGIHLCISGEPCQDGALPASVSLTLKVWSLCKHGVPLTPDHLEE